MQIASARRAPPELAALLLAALLLAGGGCRRHRAAPAPVAPAAPVAAPSARLEGRVLDGRDHPVPDARVLAFPIADGGPGRGEPGRATADLDGHFTMEHLTAGAYRVLVEAAGFPTAETSPVAAPAAALTLRVAGDGRSISGRVALAGGNPEPVEHARVLLGAEAGGPVRETRTRADGQFAFSGLGEGTYALRAIVGAGVSPTVRGVAASRDGTRLPSPLVLSSGRGDTTIAGRVVQDTGEGLGAVEVRGESADLAPGEDPLPTLARTNSSGGFTLGPFSTGGYRVIAVRAGSVLRHAPTVTFGMKDGTAAIDDAKGEKPPITLELVRGAHVTGRVTDTRGAPAASAHVRCVASAMDDLTVQTGPLPLAAEAAASPSGAGRALGSTRSAIADARGRFTVDDLIPGRYRIEVAHAGFEPLRSDELTLAPGERRDLGALALRDGFPVTGRVLDEAGGPIDGARVATTGGADPSTEGLYTVTDGAGSFSLALPAGHYRLTAGASGHGPARAEVTVQPGTAPAPLELRLPRAEAVLEGLVRDTGGRPLGRARLLAWPHDATAGASGDTPIGTASADVGGHFRMGDLPAGELRVEIQHPDYPHVTLPVTPGQFASLTVPFPGGIAGEARARASGAVVTRGRVEAVGPDGAHASTEIQRAGSFRLPRLAPGHWKLTVSAPGYRAAAQDLDVPASGALGEPSVRDLRVELDPA
jgi:protocatechuate 3,4-dioxygenase beta subunit